MGATQYNPHFKASRNKLVVAGTPKFVAVTATARKLLTIVNAI